MFITPAFAETAAATADAQPGIAGALQSTPIIPLAIVMAIFYFMVIRPQNKRATEHRAMLASLQVGDKVITGGGLLATVKKVVSDDELLLELSEGVRVTAIRSTILTKKV